MASGPLHLASQAPLPWRSSVPILAAALGLTWVLFAVTVWKATSETDGRLIYALDDAYIHLALAKNLALFGTWGITPEAFSSTSSSPLWTGLLGLIFAFAGVHPIVPLLLTFACASVALTLVWRLLATRVANRLALFVMLCAVALVTPLVPLTFTGMEHLLHAVLSLGFLYAACNAMTSSALRSGGNESAHATRAANDSSNASAGQQAHAPHYLRATLALAPLLTATRYEGMFLVLVVAGLFALKRRFGAALLVVALGALPVAVAGTVFVSKGWFFLPASVALKGNRPQIGSALDLALFLRTPLTRLNENPHIAALLAAVAFSAARYGRQVWRLPTGLMAIAFLLTSWMHAQLAAFGWFYRYDAYLVYVGVAVLMLLWCDLPSHLLAAGSTAQSRLMLALVLIVAGVPLATRALRAHSGTLGACRNIYQQQYQMAQFMLRYYPTGAIAANDIGAIAFVRDGELIDLWGLGTLEVARLKLENHYGYEQIEQLAREHQVPVAVVYDTGFDTSGGLPRSWLPVARWTISQNVVCFSPTVTFYACTPESEADLRNHLQQYQAELPRGVYVTALDAARTKNDSPPTPPQSK